jgi:hypothetical protein
MVLHIKLQHFANHQFGLAHTWVAEFEHFATIDTYQVIVLAIAIGFFIHRLTVAKLVAYHKIGFDKEIKRVVYRGATDTIVFVLHVDVERLYIKVVIPGIDFFQYGKPLRGFPLSLAIQKGGKDFLYRLHFFRCRGYAFRHCKYV